MNATEQKEAAWLKRAACGAVALTIIAMAAMTAHAGDCEPCDQVKKNVQEVLPGTAVGEVRQAPGMQGMFEIQMGKTIAYTDKEGRLFIVGHMYDPAHNRDLTAERLEDINRVNWKDLPLRDAIVSGPKDGLKVAIFTDPECPYCKQLEAMLKEMSGIRAYTFLLPLESIHPDARVKAESIWCAKDRHAALLDVILNGKELPQGSCETPISRNIQLAQSLGINGTPGLISETGRIMAGLPQSKAALMSWLKQK